jgi:hypothetical protein
MEIKLNDIYKYNFTFYRTNTVKCAALIGDKNPIDYKGSTQFKAPIMNGMLGVLFSQILYTLFAGEAAIKKCLLFIKPIIIDTSYEADCFTIKEADMKIHSYLQN